VGSPLLVTPPHVKEVIGVRMKLSQIRTLKPRDKRYKLNLDERGVYVRVATNGEVSVYYRYSVDTKNYDMKLGVFPADTQKDIETEYLTAYAKVRRGGNPKVDNKIDELEKKERLDAIARRRTLGQVAREYIEHKRIEGKIKDRTLRGYEGQIKRCILKDDIADYAIADIHLDMLYELKLKVRTERGASAAGNLHRVISNIFTFAIKERRYLKFDITTSFTQERDEKPIRERPLENDEIRLLWNNLNVIGNPVREEAIRQVLLTGQRPIEVGQMHSSQIHEGWWVLSNEQVKTYKRHRVWLTRPVEGEGWLFPAHTESGHVREDQLGKDVHKVVKRLKMDQGPDISPVLYDMRSTMVTRVSEEFGEYLAHRMVNHTKDGENLPRDRVGRAYDHYNPEKEKKIAWIWWGEQIEKITQEVKVYQFPVRKTLSE